MEIFVWSFIGGFVGALIPYTVVFGTKFLLLSWQDKKEVLEFFWDLLRGKV